MDTSVTPPSLFAFLAAFVAWFAFFVGLRSRSINLKGHGPIRANEYATWILVTADRMVWHGVPLELRDLLLPAGLPMTRSVSL